MKTYSNLYIFTYSSVLVIIIATLLSFTAFKLKPLQEKNIEIKKERDILSSIGVVSTAKNADDLFKTHVIRNIVINSKGVEIDGDAFNISHKKELEKPVDERLYPLFECQFDGQKIFITPVWGIGMWGPIWGYIALEDDFNTIYGVSFASEAETPGLGAEIDTKSFQAPFKGKKIFDESGKFVSVSIIKGGAPPGDIHGVDAISGGTITSLALQKTIFGCLDSYVTYFKNHDK
ncbi:MAG: NADH:ubiquinone reductase (Na(+)-transporting) subunit C [Bacteroidales bacterium]|nr:NADH:ubiquinone reductase (Na(+)-transporting) subunit C [Bacteroidales bacterium]